MHPFALSRADDSTTAIAAHAGDPQLDFIAGGTDLIGLMKDRPRFPNVFWTSMACRIWRGSKRFPKVAYESEHWPG